MGIESGDCGKVAELIGVKVFLGEFLAYVQLGTWISNTRMYEEHVAANLTVQYMDNNILLVETNTTLVEGIIAVSTMFIFVLY